MNALAVMGDTGYAFPSPVIQEGQEFLECTHTQGMMESTSTEKESKDIESTGNRVSKQASMD